MLEQYATTDRQREIARHVAANPDQSYADVARMLGVSRGVVSKTMLRLRKRQAQKDPKLHQQSAPEGYRLRGVSTMLDRNGQPVATWVKTAKLPEKGTEIVTAFRDMITELDLPSLGAVPAPEFDPVKGKFCVYGIGDPHVGLVTEARETGEAFDTAEAVRRMVAATAHLVSLAPPTGEALIISAGDYYEADDKSHRTRRSGHPLSADPRFHAVRQAGLAAKVQLIRLALQKHASVTVDIRIGNHDDYSALALADMLRVVFADEPRVIIADNVNPFFFFERGNVLIGSTHGHEGPVTNLAGVMATDQPEAWGRTVHRHWYTGHVHHKTVTELHGCTVETLRTLAASSRYAHGAGLRSKPGMILDVWDEEHGNPTRYQVGVV